MFDPFHPERFQGSLGRQGYFEGWYFRLADRSGRGQWAVIAGVATGSGAAGERLRRRAAAGTPDPAPPDTGRDGVFPPAGSGRHAFLQALGPDGDPTLQARFPLACFRAARGRFAIAIDDPAGGDPVFTASRDGLSLRLAQGERSLTADVRFLDPVPFPGTPFWPGIMGPYGFLPGMECRHAIVSIRHGLAGTLTADGRTLDLTGGIGYTEKDWGRSFPRAWVWVHANRFADGATFLLSAADIPWGGRVFPGFFVFLHRPDAGLTLFATYGGGRLEELTVDGPDLQGAVSGPAGRLCFRARAGRLGTLAAPRLGRMDRTVEESPDARVWVQLTAPDGAIRYEGECDGGGMEVCGRLAL